MKKTVALDAKTSLVFIAAPQPDYPRLDAPLVEIHVYGCAVASFYPSRAKIAELLDALTNLVPTEAT